VRFSKPAIPSARIPISSSIIVGQLQSYKGKLIISHLAKLRFSVFN